MRVSLAHHPGLLPSTGVTKEIAVRCSMRDLETCGMFGILSLLGALFSAYMPFSAFWASIWLLYGLFDCVLVANFRKSQDCWLFLARVIVGGEDVTLLGCQTLPCYMPIYALSIQQNYARFSIMCFTIQSATPRSHSTQRSRKLQGARMWHRWAPQGRH